jgi:hypothetical protein
MSADLTPTLADKLPGGYEVSSSLHTLLEAVAAKLRTHSIIAAKGIRVLPEYHGDLYNQLNSVINKRLSILVMVGLEGANAAHGSIQVAMKDIRLQVHVFESVLMNQGATGTKVPALALAEAAIVTLQNWQPAASDNMPNPGPLFMQKEKTLFLNEELAKPEAGMVCYTARFFTSGCLICHCD